ncbi:membrane hypothetical protein [Vibrio chagasii]|nr:membrane hypothetical protein [Vibrio chagasii]
MAVNDQLKEAFSLISERGIVGGVYLGIVAFGVLMGNVDIHSKTSLLPWLLGVCLVSGFIIVSVTYELLMPLFRLITSPLVIHGFNNALPEETTSKVSSYKKLREIREVVLSSEESAHLQKRIKNDEKLRQTLTYFVSSSIITCLTVLYIDSSIIIIPEVKRFALIIIFYITASSFLGLLFRSFSLGRSIATGYLKS